MRFGSYSFPTVFEVRTRSISICAIMVAIVAAAAQAQTPTDEVAAMGGRTYLIAFPDTTTNAQDARFATQNRHFDDHLYVFLYSAVTNSATITGPGYRKVVPLTAGQMAVVDFNDRSQIAPVSTVTISGTPVSELFRIEADEPIIVYQFMLTIFGTEAWTPLPVEAWGREYHAAMVPAETVNGISPGGELDYVKTPKMAPSEITILSAFDSTVVSIAPLDSLDGDPAVTNVVLMKDQAYQVQSWADTSSTAGAQPDLGGTRVTASKPIGVISGNTRAKVRFTVVALAENSYKNMLIEWLRPVELYGTEFVYMPTWDARRPTGQPYEDPNDKRRGEIVRIYRMDARPLTGSWTDASRQPHASRVPFSLADSDVVHEDFIEIPVARHYTTDVPAQAMMNSIAVVKFGGTTGGYGGYVGAQFDGWGAYMVEMTPRRMWPNFSPFYIPAEPTGMDHFINIVTDTSHRNDVVMLVDGNEVPMTFNHGLIPGTDLVWGTATPPVGSTSYVRGMDGARFYAFCYGLYKGHEQYVPGRTKRDEKSGETFGGGGSDPTALHPSEFQEWLGVSYGYPLAARNLVAAGTDSLSVSSTLECDGLHVAIRPAGANPARVRTVDLENAQNARIAAVTPYPAQGEDRVDLLIQPTVKESPASATLVIADAANRVYRIPYNQIPHYIRFDDGDSYDLGSVPVGTDAHLSVAFTNPTSGPVDVYGVWLVTATGPFRIDSLDRSVPASLPPGATMHAYVTFGSDVPASSYVDRLNVVLSCDTIGIVLRGAVVDTTLGRTVAQSAGNALFAAVPDPFGTTTTIAYHLGSAGHVRIDVFDDAGAPVAVLLDEVRPAGGGSVHWNAAGLPSGVYHYRIVSGAWSRTRRVVVVR